MNTLFLYMPIRFFKYQGTGNDFVLIDNRKSEFPVGDTALIHKICDRRFGVGADGLMLLEQHPTADFKMVYFNADGNESTMCGNGGRCISAFARHLGVAGEQGKFMAIDGEHEYILKDHLVHLKMIDVASISNDGDDSVLFTGSPHYVSFRKDISSLKITEEAHKVRYNATYRSEGINVNFAEDSKGRISMRTYERGVEDETLSCGTGTVAVALCVAKKNNIPAGRLEIHTPGGLLSVSFEEEGGKYKNIWLIGPAEFVFEGVLNESVLV